MFPNCINYKVANIDKVHSKFVNDGKLGLRFKQPQHLLLIQAEDKKMLKMFLHQIQDILNGKNVIIASRHMPKAVPPKKEVVNPLDPETLEYTAINRFDKRILNMNNLNKLVMENCILPSLPVHIGNLPISYLSLSFSDLNAPLQYDRDTYWNWMSMDTISNTLTTLKMDSIGMKIFPFEIFFLRNLETLSVAKNKLTYLPQYIGELRKLQRLCISDNKLRYFPDCLYTRTFKELDISDNMLADSDTLQFDHINAYKKDNQLETKKNTVHKLINLSFCSLVENSIKFKRQDIPRTLWYYYNFVVRCVHCNKFMLPDYCNVQHTIGFPSTLILIKNHAPSNIRWQSVVCYPKCS